MAFVTRIGLSGWPDAGHTLEVYPAGASRVPANLVSDLTDYEGGSTIANPYTVPSADFLSVTTPTFQRVDIWWPEGLGGTGRYIVQNAMIRSISSYTDNIGFELAVNPRKVYWVYGDSSDGGNTPDTETQASIDALIAASVPPSNIRWLYELSSSQFSVNQLTSASTSDNIAITLGSSIFTLDDAAAATLFDNVAITQASGILEADEVAMGVTIENVVMVDATSGGAFTVSAMLSSSFADNVSLAFAGGDFAIDPATSSVASDNVTIVLNSSLFTVASATSSVTADTPTLSEQSGGTDTYASSSLMREGAKNNSNYLLCRGSSADSMTSQASPDIEAWDFTLRDAQYHLKRVYAPFTIVASRTYSAATLKFNVTAVRGTGNDVVALLVKNANKWSGAAPVGEWITAITAAERVLIGEVAVSSTGNKQITFSAGALTELGNQTGTECQVILMEKDDYSTTTPPFSYERGVTISGGANVTIDVTYT